MKRLIFATVLTALIGLQAQEQEKDKPAKSKEWGGYRTVDVSKQYNVVTKAYEMLGGETGQGSTVITGKEEDTAGVPGVNLNQLSRTAKLDFIEDSAKVASQAQVSVYERERNKAALGVASDHAKIDISCDNATLAEIITQFRRVTRANIICAESKNLDRRVSVTLVDVPWLPAFTSILNSRGFMIENRDGVFYIKEDEYNVPVRMRSFTLNHADAEEIAANLNDMYATRAADGKVIAPVAKCYKSANTLIITASDPVLDDCERIIKRIDSPARQICIEARFIELSNQAMRKLGIQWDSLQNYRVSLKNLQGGVEWNGGVVRDFGKALTSVSQSLSNSQSGGGGTGTGEGGEGGTGGGAGNNSLSQSDSMSYQGLVPKDIGDAPGAGRSKDNMNWANASGFGAQLTADNFSLAMSAFENMGEAKIFSNPKIIVENGKEAVVDMTTKHPNVSVSSHRSNSGGAESLDITAELQTIPGSDKMDFAGKIFFEWGISLAVQPRISPDGLISVKIVPTISSLDGYYEVASGLAGNDIVAVPKFPIINMQRLITDFTLKDGTTAVIGGLTRTTEEDVDSGIPYLRKIPWIGQWLFGWKSRQKVQKEILVFVTVGLANPDAVPADMGLPKNAVIGRGYVDGSRREPGDRENPDNIKLDVRPIDERATSFDKSADTLVSVQVRDPEPSEPEPVKVEPAPVKVEPAPAKAEPVPVKVEPEPVKAEPEPVKAEPAPVKAEPAEEPGVANVNVLGAFE